MAYSPFFSFSFAPSLRHLPAELFVRSRRSWQLSVKRLAILQTTTQELRPCWHARNRIAPLRQQSPQLGMMPAELMARAVTVCANARPQTLDLRNQRLSIQPVDIFIHGALPSSVLRRLIYPSQLIWSSNTHDIFAISRGSSAFLRMNAASWWLPFPTPTGPPAPRVRAFVVRTDD